MANKHIIITGSAGFIGFHLAKLLLSEGHNIIGIDSMSDYYDVNLKIERNKFLKKYDTYKFLENDISNIDNLKSLYKNKNIEYIIHLAAQAGVRYSIDHPKTYVDSNLVGTFNVLELSKKLNIKHLLIASTSSVYGSNKKYPFHENDSTDKQMSFYAATKKSNEMMAHSYSHIHKIPTTVMRFFTVYGPWGRPDMALFKFVNLISKDQKIDVFNHGKMKRDFTYVDDVAKAISLLSKIIPNSDKKIINDSLSDVAPFRVVNIGNSRSIKLLDYISEIEDAVGKRAKKNFLDIQKGDVEETLSDNTLLYDLTGFKPKINFKTGIKNFVQWYNFFYGFKNES